MTTIGASHEHVIDWLARLPLCGEQELAGLLGFHEHDARRLTYELSRRGWVESVEPCSPELELRRRYIIRVCAVPLLSRVIASAGVAGHFPVRLQDVVRRLGRPEITTGVNRLVSDLAGALRKFHLAELADARSLPLSCPPHERWWLPGVDGYACLRAGQLWAPFFIVWDRASAPDTHRRARVAAWSRACAGVGQHWSADGLPLVLVVCPSSREEGIWEHALAKQQATSDAPAPSMLVTTREALRARGVGGATWRLADHPVAAPLVELLGWGTEPAIVAPRVPEGQVAAATLASAGPTIRQWAVEQAVSPLGSHQKQRAAALALVAGIDEQLLIEWVARHPLLSASELAALTNQPALLVARRLEWVMRCHAIGAAHINVIHRKDRSHER